MNGEAATNLESIVADLVERAERRFYGKYRGVVVDNHDPASLGRLKVRVPSVLGDSVVSGWATPCVPYGGAADQGFLFIPDAGAGVWVEFEEGDLEFPIWTGMYWSKPAARNELPRPSGADSPQQPPTCKIIRTAKGHTVQFEDADGSERILIRHSADSFVSMDHDGGVLIYNPKGSHIHLDAANETATFVEGHGNNVVMSADGIALVNNKGAMINMTGDTVHIRAAKIVLDATSVALGAGAALPAVLGPGLEQLWTTLLAHTHQSTAPGSPTGPAATSVPPLVPQKLAPGVHTTSAVVVK